MRKFAESPKYDDTSYLYRLFSFEIVTEAKYTRCRDTLSVTVWQITVSAPNELRYR